MPRGDHPTRTTPHPQPPARPEPAGAPAPNEDLARRLRQVHDPDLDAAMDAIIAQAPPLTDEDRARLAFLLNPHRQHRPAA
jgi:hypothetical protein